ncbi:MAG: outer membrane protein OmpK [Pseudobdellovibrionaceae bacterium]|nr:outer membrane protein OmpK [Pseudobdellovibrionaceae bacterium]
MTMNRSTWAKTALTVVLGVGYVPASMAFDWGATHVVFLKGDGYEVPDKLSFPNGKVVSEKADTVDTEIVTFEHVNGTKWGDTFFFLDATNPSTLKKDIYFEFNPRISSKKTLGMSYGSVLEDVLLTVQYNAGGAASASPVYLYGLALDFKVPGFDFVQSHFYVRDDRAVDGTAAQVTLVWSSHFEAGIKWEFSGFLDYATEEGKASTGVKVANLLTQPTLYALLTDNFALGLEYQYWSNKFGIDKLQDNVPQLALRVNL